uniref:Uncharacterized protein n=1 Tax=Saccharolobus solfataricus (strain 98/2) TaxID=555311 RepID=D0KPZ1_SACS9
MILGVPYTAKADNLKLLSLDNRLKEIERELLYKI